MNKTVDTLACPDEEKTVHAGFVRCVGAAIIDEFIFWLFAVIMSPLAYLAVRSFLKPVFRSYLSPIVHWEGGADLNVVVKIVLLLMIMIFLRLLLGLLYIVFQRRGIFAATPGQLIVGIRRADALDKTDRRVIFRTRTILCVSICLVTADLIMQAISI